MIVKHNSTTYIYSFIYFEQTGPFRPLTVNTVGYKKSPGHAILFRWFVRNKVGWGIILPLFPFDKLQPQ